MGECEVKVLLADDHALFKDGLRHILRNLNTQVTLLEACDYASLEVLLQQHPDADLALVDLNMPGRRIGGIEALMAMAPTVPLVVLSGTEDALVIRQLLDAGVMGYIAKRETADVMLSALRIVLSGGIYVPPSLLKQPASAGETLTARQIDVLIQLCAGKSNKLIGRELAMSEGTVKSHIASIYRTLNVSNRTQATRVAIALGLLADEASV
jgi:DNA-binding NarL/FixJ family response regulator